MAMGGNGRKREATGGNIGIPSKFALKMKSRRETTGGNPGIPSAFALKMKSPWKAGNGRQRETTRIFLETTKFTNGRKDAILPSDKEPAQDPFGSKEGKKKLLC